MSTWLPAGRRSGDHGDIGSGRGTISTAQMAAFAVAAVFLVVGVLGFIPGITTDYSSMQLAGNESQAMLLGVFQVSILHNAVHLAFGLVGAAMARSHAGARNFLVGGGVVYLLLWVYGLVVDAEAGANFVPVNSADNWLHLGLGLVMLAAGLALGRRTGHD